MEEYSKEVLQEIQEFVSISNKFSNNEVLTLDELDKLFICYQFVNDKIALSDNRFEYSKFRQLYITYGLDLDFKSTYYKFSPNKSNIRLIDYGKLREINEKEYNPELNREIGAFLISNQIKIPVEKQDVERDKLLLEKKAKDWALACLNERQSNEELKTIAKETRDTLRKKNIEAFVDNTLPDDLNKDTFKGLLKSYYVFHEALRIMETINSKKEPKHFFLNGISFEINQYSLIHILNRHYAEVLSSNSITSSKSFHNTKINPYTIHLFINNLISLIKAKGIENKIKVQKAKAILINFHKIDYAIFINEYKYDKSKTILDTFFIIESGNPKAESLINQIDKSLLVELDNDLSIYI